MTSRGRLFVVDEQQPVRSQADNDEHPGVLRTVPPASSTKAGYADSCRRKMVAKAIASGFRAVLDSTIALGVQVNWRNRGSVAGGYPFASWQHYACRCAGRPLGCQAIVGLSDEDLHRLSHQPRVISTTIIWCGSQPRARCGVYDLLRKVEAKP